jgi:hypothetical protein
MAGAEKLRQAESIVSKNYSHPKLEFNLPRRNPSARAWKERFG